MSELQRSLDNSSDLSIIHIVFRRFMLFDVFLQKGRREAASKSGLYLSDRKD